MKKSAQPIQILKRVSLVEKVNFTKHLATMLKAGITLDEGIETLIEQATNPYFKKVLREALKSIKNGQTLSEALGQHKNAFSHFYISLLKVSEKSGTLEENMKFLAEQLSKSYILKKKIQSAMLYPTLIITASFVIGGFISLFILPQLVEFFDSFEVELPISTKILLAVANFMKDSGFIFFGGIILALINLRALIAIQAVKKIWHKILLRIPIVGKIVKLSQLAKLSRNWGILLKSGVPISEALSVTSDTLSNLRFKEITLYLEKTIAGGENIHITLKQKKINEIPPIFVTMIKVGEKSGTLEESLLYLGDYYEDELDSLSNNLTTMMEPILLLAIGLGVGFIALAIVTPIYELTGSF